MPRRLRIQYPGAIYHVMSRENARQDVVEDDDRRRLLNGLERVSKGCGWEMLAFVMMSNHLHLMVRTPRPNLAAGMHRFLSAYALYHGRRHRRPGHLFQGRYKAEMIEDESYYWTVSRYVHLNPVRAGIVEPPGDWTWSSCPGYANRTRRLSWVDYDQVSKARQGSFGGSDPARDYRRFVEAGLAHPPPSPFREAFDGWALGSRRFVERLKSLVRPQTSDPPQPEARRLSGLDPDRVLAVVAEFYGLEPDAFAIRRDAHIARAVAAWLCRRHTEAPLRDLAPRLALSSADSVPNLTRKLDARLRESPALADELRRIARLLGTEPPDVRPDDDSRLAKAKV